MHREAWIDQELEEAERQHLRRRLTVFPEAGGILHENGCRLLNFSCNDYLGLAAHPDVLAAAHAALDRYGAGATASRLVSGTLPCHVELEEHLARLKGYPAALVFGSGYAANLGILSALLGRGDTVYADRLAHASLLDGIRLSGATLRRFRHNDPEHLAALLEKDAAGGAAKGRRMIVTESVFSMDGDLAPLPELARLAARYETLLLVDEAHATGVFGPGGSGRVREAALEGAVHLSMGTLSKALGGSGGFVACSERMKQFLVNRARAFIYSTAPPPAAVGAALGALAVLERTPSLGAKLLRRAAFLREQLKAAGFDTLGSESQIVPVRIGDNERALALMERLRADGLLAPAIRPPTVPPGTARLRLSVTLAHTVTDLDSAAAAIQRAAAELGPHPAE